MSSNKPIIEPIYKEWWKKGRIVATKQGEADIRLDFHVGWFAAMGMMAKLNAMDTIVAKRVASQMMAECKKKLYKTGVPKFKASINGEDIS